MHSPPQIISLQNLIKRGIGFIIIVYSTFMAFVIILLMIQPIINPARNIQTNHQLTSLITLISATLASYYYLKKYSFPSERAHMILALGIGGPKNQTFRYYFYVISLFTVLFSHLIIVLFPNILIAKLMQEAMDSYGFIFVGAIVVIAIQLIIFLILMRIEFMKNRPIVVILILIVSILLGGQFVEPYFDTLQPHVSNIGLFIIGSFPLAIVTVLFAPKRFLATK